jgi:uncharacterized protein
MPATIIRVDEVPAVPWRNGGGVTRELLAWPDARNWLLRVSVADIGASGPFSAFPGVDRWFAVLSGDGVRLETAGAPPVELTAAQDALHEFSGDLATGCTALGATTRDFNLMAQRAAVQLRQRPLGAGAQLGTHAAGAGLFVTRATEVSEGNGPATPLPAMALAWWPNPRRGQLRLRAASASVRGWWFEVEAVC